MIAKFAAALLVIAGLVVPWCAAAADPQAAPRSTVTTGDIAPDFTLDDQNGRKFSLSGQLKTHPVVVVFYRGYW